MAVFSKSGYLLQPPQPLPHLQADPWCYILWHFQGAQILSFVYDLISRALPHKMEPLEFHLIGFEDQNF